MNYKRKSYIWLKVLAGILSISATSLSGQRNSESDRPIIELDSYEIRGNLASQRRALEIRRNSENIIDAISATDVDALPDKNVAEALQRVPGVAIDRQRGEGALVSLRGLGPQFVRVSINGRTAPSNVNGQRSFSFDQLQSEMIDTLEVYKTAQADLIEGGLAGTVNVKTRRPLDIGRRIFAGSAFATYNTLADNTDPRFSVIYSDMNSDETFGALISASIDDRTIREDNVDVPDYQVRNFDLDDDGINEVGGFFPGNVRAFMPMEQRERINVNSSLQWKPQTDFTAGIDLVYTKFDTTVLNHGMPFRTQAGIANNATQVEASDGIVTFFETTGARPRANVTKNSTESELSSVGGYLDFQVNDNLKLEMDLSFSENQSPGVNRRTFYDQSGVLARYDIRGDKFIQDVFLDQALLDDPTRYRQGLLTRSLPDANDELLNVRIDATTLLESPLVYSIKAGIFYSDRERNFSSRTLRVPTFLQSPLTDVQHGAFPVNDFLSGIDAPTYPSGWAIPDIDNVFKTYLEDRRSEIPQSVFENESNDVQQDYIITEETIAGYLMANLSGQLGDIPFSGNVGVRITSTEQVSTGVVQPITGFEVVPGTTAPQFIFGDPERQSFPNEYSELLPSFNLNFDVQENVRLRFAGSKVLSRPSFVDLNPGTASANASTRVVRSGNPNLDPFTAWQFDVSLEWYASESSLFAVSLFTKDVDSFINTVTTLEEFIDPDTGQPVPDPDDPATNVTLSRIAPRNEEGATIEGAEFIIQHTFEGLPEPFNSMGGQFNYTYITSDAAFLNPNTGAVFDVPGLSKNSYNFMLFYENGPWGIRAAYNVRDDFLNNISDTRGNPRFTRRYSQLDGSLSYAVNEQLDLILQAVNINDENREDFNLVGGSDRELLRFVNDTGRRFFGGARFRF